MLLCCESSRKCHYAAQTTPTWTKTVLTCTTKLIAVQPSMAEYEWTMYQMKTRIIMLSCTEISFAISFFDFEKFGVKSGFPFFVLFLTRTVYIAYGVHRVKWTECHPSLLYHKMLQLFEYWPHTCKIVHFCMARIRSKLSSSESSRFIFLTVNKGKTFFADPQWSSVCSWDLHLSQQKEKQHIFVLDFKTLLLLLISETFSYKT